jgi:hypothetical protein
VEQFRQKIPYSTRLANSILYRPGKSPIEHWTLDCTLDLSDKTDLKSWKRRAGQNKVISHKGCVRDLFFRNAKTISATANMYDDVQTYGVQIFGELQRKMISSELN